METKSSPFSKKHYRHRKGLPDIPNLTRPVVSTDWTEEISRLEKLFAGVVLPTGDFKLNAWTTITDLAGCIESGMNHLKANNGNRTFYPYLEELQDIELLLLPDQEREDRKPKMQLITTPQKQRTKSKKEKSIPVADFVL